MKRAYLSLLAIMAFMPAIGFAQQPKDPPAKEVVVPPELAPLRATGYVPLTPERRAHFQKLSNERHGHRIKRMAENQVLPPAFDARVKVPLPVGDQRNCGSCYIYSTVHGTATCALLRAGWGKADNSFLLSVQYGMDRPRNFGGCNGGNGTEVIDWMIKHGWPCETYVDETGVVHNDYPPYEARSGADRMKPGAKLWMKDASWGFVNANGNPTTEEIKAALYNFGRLNCSLDAGGQFGNGTGTITSLGTQIDHEIQIAAFDDTKDGGCFLLENQWNIQWGNGGYRWVTYKAARNIVDIFFVSATPLPPPPPPVPPGPKPPTPGTFTPPFYAVSTAGITGPFYTIIIATPAAQIAANSCQCTVTIMDSRAATAATVTPSAPPTPPTPTNTIVITNPGTYQVVEIKPATAKALVGMGMTVEQYLAAAEQLSVIFGTRQTVEPPCCAEGKK